MKKAMAILITGVMIFAMTGCGAKADNAAEALQALRDLTKEGSDYAIIYIEEKLAQEISHEIAKHKDSPTPAIILIPGREGSLGLGTNALHEAVERAVGMNILGD